MDSIVFLSLEATLASNYLVISVLLAFVVVAAVLTIMVNKGLLSPAAFFAILGILFICLSCYYLQNNHEPLDSHCPNCGTENAFGDDYCSSCGASLTADVGKLKICRKCFKAIRAGASYCPNCGSSQAEESTPAATCGNCGKSIARDFSFCPNCGEPQNHS